jgi:hypothetical protein
MLENDQVMIEPYHAQWCVARWQAMTKALRVSGVGIFPAIGNFFLETERADGAFPEAGGVRHSVWLS